MAPWLLDGPELAQMIRTCQGAGFETALWAYVRARTKADNLVVIAFDRQAPPQALCRANTAGTPFGRLEEAYLDWAYLLDPVYRLHQDLAPPGAYHLARIAPDAFHRSRYWLEYYRQTTILDEIVFLARPTPDMTLTLCLGRDATSGRAFGASVLDGCHSIAPVIAALAERHWQKLQQQPVKAAPKGQSPPAQDLAASLAARHDIRLTPRQAEVAAMILQGHSSLSIALALGLSVQTIKVFRRQIHQRCGVSSHAELFALFLPKAPL